MLKPVLVYDGKPFTGEQGYLLEDPETHQHYWLSNSAQFLAYQAIRLKHRGEGLSHVDAIKLADIEVFEDWEPGMEGITEAKEEEYDGPIPPDYLKR